MSEKRSTGEGTGRLGRWLRGGKHPREGRGGDVHQLDVEGDPRGGAQSDSYRHADPRDLVVEDGHAMMGPGGHPVEEREPQSTDETPSR